MCKRRWGSSGLLANQRLKRLERNVVLIRGACAIRGFNTSQPRLTMESASMMASETHTIHPLLPVCQSPTGPVAQPRDLANGDRTPQPKTAPKSICIQVAGPMMIPCPTYAGDGFRVQRQFCARERPSMGISRTWGTKYEKRVYHSQY